MNKKNKNKMKISIDKKDKKLYHLFQQAKIFSELEYLFLNDPNTIYSCYDIKSKNYTHLHKCVMRVDEYTFLVDYIDEYLQVFPDDIDKRNSDGWTPLMIASDAIVEILLKHGANVNAQSNDGLTALMISIVHGSEKKVKILLENHSDVNIQCLSGWNALMLATKYSKEDLVKLILANKANVHFRTKDGLTALMVAVTRNISITKLLLENGSDPNDIYKGVPIIKIIYKKYQKGEIEIDTINLLIQHGAEIPADDDLKGDLKTHNFTNNILEYINQDDIKVYKSSCHVCCNDDIKITECGKEHRICFDCLSRLSSIRCEFCHPRN